MKLKPPASGRRSRELMQGNSLRRLGNSVVGRKLGFLSSAVHITQKSEGQKPAKEAKGQQENHIGNSGEQPMARTVGHAQRDRQERQ